MLAICMKHPTIGKKRSVREQKSCMDNFGQYLLPNKKPPLLLQVHKINSNNKIKQNKSLSVTFLFIHFNATIVFFGWVSK